MTSLTLTVWNAFDSRTRLIWRSTPVARMRGAFTALIGAAGLASFATYNPDDPSLDTATHATVHNLLGGFGAILADIGMQSIGFAAWPAAALMIWFGTLRVFHPDPDQNRRQLRFQALWALVFILALAATVAPLMTSDDSVTAQSVGGFWGSGLSNLLKSLFDFMKLPATAVFASLVWAAVALFGFNQTLKLKLADYMKLLSMLGGGFGHLGLDRMVTGLNRSAQVKVRTPRAPKVKAFVDEGAFDAFEDEDEDLPVPQVAMRAPAVEEPRVMDIKPPKPSGRIEAEKQPVFDFLRPGNFRLPELSILAKPKPRSHMVDEDSLRQNARMLESVLAEFGVRGVIDQIRPGPVVTLYELAPAAGVKGARVVALADDIARNMSARSCRVSIVQGRNAIGIELPNALRDTVYLRDLLASKDYESVSQTLPMALGETIGGEPYIVDLAKMPHLLIAGTTGSGKSVGVNAMILSILYRLDPEQCKFIMIDPKMLELSVYDGIPHLLAPVVTDPKKAVVALKWTVKEMEDRYRRMSKIGVRNIASFNERARATAAEGKNFVRKVQTGFDETGQPVYEFDEMVPEPMPYIVVIIDEVADLMMVAGKDIEGAVQRLAQMARAAGIHLIMATQRPSVDVITGTIKANFPTRISFQVTSSR